MLPVTLLTDCQVYTIGRGTIVTLRPSTGFVSVSCWEYADLNGCHWWSHRGNQSLAEFLLGVDRHYAIGKLFDRDALKEFDLELSIAGLKEAIIEMRRNARDYRRGPTADRAREMWDDVASVETDSDIARIEWLDEPWNYIVTTDKPCVTWFWDSVWASFMAHLRAQIAAGADPIRMDGPDMMATRAEAQ